MPRRFSSHHRVRAFALWTNFLLVAAVSGLLPKSATADLFYKVEKVVKLTDSGLNPSADGSIPISVTGLNDAGWFVGYFPSATANKLHAFVWNNTSKSFLDLNNLLAADSSMATCLNDQGTVAGVFWELGTYAEKGFVYYPDGTVSTFTSPDSAGGDILAVTAINTNGDLIGSYADANGMTRGYTVQQGENGATAIDLGNLSQPGFNQYVWPNALNDSRQIVGNVYLFPRVGRGASYTEGFFWDGGMTLIDASDLSSNWTAVAVNGSGQAVGLYGLGDLSGAPFAVTGSYFWDGQADLDLGDLGGGNGASVFALTDPGFAVGTSLSVDGTLHLFSATTGNGVSDPMVDSGSVSLYNGDTSFVPLSLSSTVVRAKPGSSATSLNDIAGFGTDAAGNTLSLLWMNNGIHSVVDLLPAYLSFSTISYAYGSRVLINDAEQIACAGTDSNGQQMALLLSVDPDTDNDGLPDSWEMQYYGHLGVDKNALEASGGSLTNWEAYQQGVNPVDFYNGHPPSLAIVSGGGQSAAPGSFLPAPLAVQVADASGNPISGAPVTFAVASGSGQLQAARNSSGKTTITAFTDGDGQAKAFFQVSSTAGVTSDISVILTGTNSSVASSFQETADSNAPTNPAPTDPANPPTPEEVPVQRYASIDVSGNATTSNVDMVALSDDNHVAFGFGTGTDPSGYTNGPCEYHTFTWQDGVLGQENVTQLVSSKPWVDPSITEWLICSPASLLSNGTIYGVQDEQVQQNSDADPASYGQALFSSVGGTPNIIKLPSPILPTPDIGFNFGYFPKLLLAKANEDGTLVGWTGLADITLSAQSEYVGSLGFLYNPAGSCVIFPEAFFFTLASDEPALPGNITVQAGTLIPSRSNKNGWCIGVVGDKASSGVGNGFVYEGNSTLISLGADNPVGLNDQGQIIVPSGFAENRPDEGYLWENGTKTFPVDHLPAELVGQIIGIQPSSISNQTAPGTDATIYILATASVTQSDGTVVNGAPIVCTRDNDGDWSFAQVGVPSNVSSVNITTINSGGELAFTWYDNGTNDDSGQTSSTFIRAVRSAQASGWAPQPAQTPSGNKKVSVGPMLDLKSNTTNSEAKDDDAWKRAKKAYDPRKSLQVV